MEPEDKIELPQAPFESFGECAESWKTVRDLLQKQAQNIDDLLRRLKNAENNLEILRVEVMRNGKLVAEFFERCLKCNAKRTALFADEIEPT